MIKRIVYLLFVNLEGIRCPNDGSGHGHAGGALGSRIQKAGKHGILWRNHGCELACAELWSREARGGEPVKIPGQTLDYVVMVKSDDALSEPLSSGPNNISTSSANINHLIIIKK